MREPSGKYHDRFEEKSRATLRERSGRSFKGRNAWRKPGMAAERSKGWVLEANGVTTPLSRHGKVSSPPRRKLIPNPPFSHSLSTTLGSPLSPSCSLNFDQQLQVSSSFIPGDCTFVPSCARGRLTLPSRLTPGESVPVSSLTLLGRYSAGAESLHHGGAILFDGRTHDGKSGTSSLVPANVKARDDSRRVEFTRAASRIFTSTVRSLYVRSLVLSRSVSISLPPTVCSWASSVFSSCERIRATGGCVLDVASNRWRLETSKFFVPNILVRASFILIK